MTIPSQPQPAAPLPPDLQIPHGRVTLRTVVEGLAALQVNELETLDVLLPAGTQYQLEIKEVRLGRWRPKLGASEGVWSFWCRLGEAEWAWLEGNGLTEEWQINYGLSAPDGIALDGQAQPRPSLGS